MLKTAQILKVLELDQSLQKSQLGADEKPNSCLEQIHKFSRRKLNEDEVFVFSMILCDNEVDREFEKFSDQSLDELKSLFLGKTGVFDHVPSGANQTARIFFTDVVTDLSKTNSLGQPYRYLLAKAYMVRSEKNKDLILEIDAGIKKEVSVGCAVKSKICSICGSDRKVSLCEHLPGEHYTKDNKKVLCFLSLQEPTDAYEWSFVAVPAQVNAGVIKNFAKNTNSNQKLNSKSAQKMIPEFNILKSEISEPDIFETDISQIKKSLTNFSEKNSSCLISAKTLKLLTKHISDLETKSTYFAQHFDKLKTEVFKKFLVCQPFLKQSSVNNIVNNLTYHELLDLKESLDSEFDSKFDSESKSKTRVFGSSFRDLTQLTPAKQDCLEPENKNLDSNDLNPSNNLSSYKL